jgi:N-methylhydantoinase A
LRAAPESLPEVALALSELRREGTSLLDQDGVPAEARELAVSADMRYHGQAFELVVPWSGAQADPRALERLIAGFHALHRQRFSYANPGDPVEIVTVRVAAIGRLPRAEESRSAATSASRGRLRRRVFLDGAWHEIDIHRRAELREPIAGPALIEEEYTTVFVAAGWTCGPGVGGDLLARRSGPAAQGGG